MGSVTEMAEAWRQAIGTPGETKAREALAAAIRKRALAKLRLARSLDYDEREDIAQIVMAEMLGRIEEGTAEVGKESSLVSVNTGSRAIDYLRARTRRQDHEVRLRPRSGAGDEQRVDPLETMASSSPDAEAQMVERDEQELRKQQFARVVGLLEKAPDAYRDALTAIYVQGRSIESLAEQELKARLEDFGDPAVRRAALKRARNTVDARLTRGRRWLQDHAACLSREAGE